MAEIELREVALFSEMDEQEVAGIRELMDELKFKSGQTIVREGETGNLFHIITEGEVRVTILDADGNSIVLNELGPGGFFGELSMLTSEPRSARVFAVTNVTTLALERDEFFAFLRQHPSASIDVLIELGGRLHAMDAILRRSASRNVNEVDEESLTLGQRVADVVADTMGSWPFIIVQSTILAIWIALNATAWINHWDPYPFILLNLTLSFQAAYAAPFIMMSQNRQDTKDRLRGELDYQVNRRAESEILRLSGRLHLVGEQIGDIEDLIRARLPEPPKGSGGVSQKRHHE